MLTRREAREHRTLHPTESAAAVSGDVDAGLVSFASDRTPVDATIRVLIVCTGNVIRSALAERALRQQFALMGAEGFVFSSAGTRAAVGQGMWRESVEIARAYGFEYRDFVARQLDEEILHDIDYVIVAAREHREAVLRLRPDLLRRTFTFRELIRILDGGGSAIDAVAGDGGPVERWVALTAWADRQRIVDRAADPADDDLDDPRDGGREALWSFERDFIRGIVTIVSAVSGDRR